MSHLTINSDSSSNYSPSITTSPSQINIFMPSPNLSPSHQRNHRIISLPPSDFCTPAFSPQNECFKEIDTNNHLDSISEIPSLPHTDLNGIEEVMQKLNERSNTSSIRKGKDELFYLHKHLNINDRKLLGLKILNKAMCESLKSQRERIKNLECYCVKLSEKHSQDIRKLKKTNKNLRKQQIQSKAKEIETQTMETSVDKSTEIAKLKKSCCIIF